MLCARFSPLRVIPVCYEQCSLPLMLPCASPMSHRDAWLGKNGLRGCSYGERCWVSPGQKSVTVTVQRRCSKARPALAGAGTQQRD